MQSSPTQQEEPEETESRLGNSHWAPWRSYPIPQKIISPSGSVEPHLGSPRIVLSFFLLVQDVPSRRQRESFHHSRSESSSQAFAYVWSVRTRPGLQIGHNPQRKLKPYHRFFFALSCGQATSSFDKRHQQARARFRRTYPTDYTYITILLLSVSRCLL
ncbi:uncharacterized protein BO72DRAFT_74584 [Aspergillus fijiensis CBS 313.89]|uniref:Uncharacterized protein n=1 Tax=Aspergillus fijiensis CBS 313.89 TaxID=1448319 RepID=A0A8G1VZN0_9EURO|nr:uncharacterized protein BO72DRAFT_74584 [Aspergillus fijiensis CBS 313.89]RAK78467.1 hypothetical protein BO72DRAFT_74584 [Aspergillus fijiensis CBS 313.89]